MFGIGPRLREKLEPKRHIPKSAMAAGTALEVMAGEVMEAKAATRLKRERPMTGTNVLCGEWRSGVSRGRGERHGGEGGNLSLISGLVCSALRSVDSAQILLLGEIQEARSH